MDAETDYIYAIAQNITYLQVQGQVSFAKIWIDIWHGTDAPKVTRNLSSTKASHSSL